MEYEMGADKRRELKITGEHLSKLLEKEKMISPSLFTDLKALNFVELSESPLLTCLPNELGNLALLTNLVLQGNHLEKLPDTLGQLKKLKFLDVSRNSLVDLPPSIGECSELQTLLVAHNQLRELPSSLTSCVHLARVDAAHNDFEQFPSALVDAKLQHLAEISLKANCIGDIPTSISQLAALKSLDVSENKIRAVPGELGDCSKLKDLQLRGNELTDRRFRKLIEDGVQKAILDYVKKHCAKVVVKKVSKQKSAAKSANAKSTSESSTGFSDGGNANEMESAKNEIAISPSRSDAKIIWHKSVAEVRPHVLFCIIWDVDLKEPKALKEFLSLQTKLHEHQCNRRMAATIATHDLCKIQFPLLYAAKAPEEITIRSLHRPNACTAAELVSQLTAEAEQLRKEKKRHVYSGVHQYLNLVKDKPTYACLSDAGGVVISFPPIINSDATKMSTTTKDLLLEVTSDKDLATCKRVMEALVKAVFTSSLIRNVEDKKVKSMTIEQVKIWNEDGTLRSAYPSKLDLCEFEENVKIVREWVNASDDSE